MEFEWDEAKSRSNRQKHGVDFDTALLIFDDEFAYYLQDRVVGGEERWQVIGQVAGQLLMVAHTWLPDVVVRIISARKATRHERKEYYAHRSSQA